MCKDRIIWGIMVVLAVLCGFWAAVGSSSARLLATSQYTSQAPSSPEETLKQSEKDLQGATVKGDIAGVERYLAPDAVLVTARGVMAREEWLKNLRMTKLEAYDVETIRAKVYADTGLVTSKWSWVGTVGERKIVGAGLRTDVWVHHNGSWKLVLRQASASPPPPMEHVHSLPPPVKPQ